ncbi:MAG: hypothetical protein KAT43_00165 [Nanoarchaeota archaeon]|nr:hypothetical protein [Nanoarchaeota archaeon]
MKKILFILTFILLFAAFASAETTILRFDFDLYSNDTIMLKDITASTGTFEESENGDLPYQMVLVDEDNVMHLLSFDEIFLRMTDPPTVVEKKSISKKLPYLGNVGELFIYHDEKLLFNYDMEELCNHDAICSGFENELICPKDCVIKEQESVSKTGREEKKIEEIDLTGKKIQFVISIGIICMILALVLIILLTKHKKGHGKRK